MAVSRRRSARSSFPQLVVRAGVSGRQRQQPLEVGPRADRFLLQNGDAGAREQRVRQRGVGFQRAVERLAGGVEITRAAAALPEEEQRLRVARVAGQPGRESLGRLLVAAQRDPCPGQVHGRVAVLWIERGRALQCGDALRQASRVDVREAEVVGQRRIGGVQGGRALQRGHRPWRIALQAQRHAQQVVRLR